jgi:hypothetical protein
MPVVGGYLAFIGQYCLEAAVGLMSSGSIAVDCTPLYSLVTDPSQKCGWAEVWSHNDPILILAGVVLGYMLYLVAHKVQHFAALPVAMVGIPIGFYLIMLVTGTSLNDARDFGWMKHSSAAAGSTDGHGSTSGCDEEASANIHRPDDSTDYRWPAVVRPWEAFVSGSVQWHSLPAIIPTWFAMYPLHSICLPIVFQKYFERTTFTI